LTAIEIRLTSVIQSSYMIKALSIRLAVRGTPRDGESNTLIRRFGTYRDVDHERDHGRRIHNMKSRRTNPVLS